jgi:hypothetical protein
MAKGSREWGVGGRGENKKNYLFPLCSQLRAPLPLFNTPDSIIIFVFLILFNCDAKIFKVFANLYYLI